MSHFTEKSKSSHTTIAIVVPTVVVAALLILIYICLRKRKARINLEGMWLCLNSLDCLSRGMK